MSRTGLLGFCSISWVVFISARAHLHCRPDTTDSTTTPTLTITATAVVRACGAKPCGKWRAVNVQRCPFLTTNKVLQGPGILAMKLAVVCAPGWLLQTSGNVLDGLVIIFQIMQPERRSLSSYARTIRLRQLAHMLPTYTARRPRHPIYPPRTLCCTVIGTWALRSLLRQIQT